MVLEGHLEPVFCAAFSPDGRRLVTGSFDGAARLWDAATGQQVMLFGGHEGSIVGCSFSPDGKLIATASDDNTARIWDVASGQQIQVLYGHTSLVETAVFSPDGLRMVSASDDNTARIWDARVPLLSTQIKWAEVAQFDPLPGAERARLGLSKEPDVRQWPVRPSKCDERAAAPYDPSRQAPGIMSGQIITDIALQACAQNPAASDIEARMLYQHARAAMAAGNFARSRSEFEEAVARGYPAARIDLAMLLLQPSAGLLDAPKAVSLYEQAWRDGVAIAAFGLGSLYEHGVSKSAAGSRNDENYLTPDQTHAWFWYRQGAAVGEPSALARLAEQEADAAFVAENGPTRTFHQLESFKYYAAASDRARIEEWPEDAWRNWRYHRASLARLLERSGMTKQVADAYDEVRRQYAPPPPTIWRRLSDFGRSPR
jgi:hypothetical protein